MQSANLHVHLRGDQIKHRAVPVAMANAKLQHHCSRQTTTRATKIRASLLHVQLMQQQLHSRTLFIFAADVCKQIKNIMSCGGNFCMGLGIHETRNKSERKAVKIQRKKKLFAIK